MSEYEIEVQCLGATIDQLRLALGIAPISELKSKPEEEVMAIQEPTVKSAEEGPQDAVKGSKKRRQRLRHGKRGGKGGKNSTQPLNSADARDETCGGGTIAAADKALYTSTVESVSSNKTECPLVEGNNKARRGKAPAATDSKKSATLIATPANKTGSSTVKTGATKSIESTNQNGVKNTERNIKSDKARGKTGAGGPGQSPPRGGAGQNNNYRKKVVRKTMGLFQCTNDGCLSTWKSAHAWAGRTASCNLCSAKAKVEIVEEGEWELDNFICQACNTVWQSGHDENIFTDACPNCKVAVTKDNQTQLRN